MIEEVGLEVEPVGRDVAAEGALATVAGRVAAAVHVEQRAVAEHGTARADVRRLPLAQVGQNLLVREVGQNVHQVSLGAEAAARRATAHRV